MAATLIVKLQLKPATRLVVLIGPRGYAERLAQGLQGLEGHGWQPVRLVALDETWSAMRFRPNV